MIETYLKKRDNLQTTFVLLDARLEPQAIDIAFIQWMGTEGIPFALVFTKSDKISRGKLASSKSLWEKKLLTTWEELPPLFITSAEDRRGKDDLLKYIQTLLTSN